ncbi:MAG: HpcH/HpaI aldolase family protein [Planctomycetota bacterium]|jgi:4-hydroxy-2-oxoheptanedioate aldolase
MRKKLFQGLIVLAAGVFVSGSIAVSPQAAQKQPEYLHLNKVIDKLERDLLVTGIWVNCLHPSTAIALARLNGFPSYEQSLTKPMVDFILIDMEHEPFDTSQLRDFLLSLNSRREVIAKGNLQPNVTVLVRVPEDADGDFNWMAKQVLDCGAHGVIVPHVRNAEQAEKVVKACRYPHYPQRSDSPIAEPDGVRGAGPRLCSYLWGVNYKEYIDRADVWPLNPKGDLLAIVMIEDQDGVRNIDEILSVKGVGAVMFGPYDYSFACGEPGNQRHPKVTKTWDKVKKACDRHNVPMIGFANPRNIHIRVKENHRMLLIGQDYDLTGKASGVLEYLRRNKPGLKVSRPVPKQ